jgi:high affinity Mn2+ porin
MFRCLSLFLVLTLLAATAFAQDQPSSTVFEHPADQPFYIGGQINLIYQAHGDFRALYSGPQSMRDSAEQALSRLLTLYSGIRFAKSWSAFLDLESAGGKGLSDALGLAGFTNLDVVRNPSLGSRPYLARLIVHGVIPLSSEERPADPGPLSLETRLPVRRLEVHAGRLSLVDFFDSNAVGSDSHLQFTNWTIDNNGGYDYAADTRGYTYGLVVEFDTAAWAFRGGVALMPTVANGIDLDWDVGRARGENVEVEWRSSRGGVLRGLGYINRANMGSYREAIQAFESGQDLAPDITVHRRQGRIKYGTGVNAEQALPKQVRAFARVGWNEGDSESFAYTEVNNTVSAGMDVTGDAWRRSRDKLGVAFVTNGLSEPHREYLRLGGLGFLLGDGTLTYGRETIVESYYTARLWRGVSASGGAQFVVHPGYNRDRGPITVVAARLHIDL